MRENTYLRSIIDDIPFPVIIAGSEDDCIVAANTAAVNSAGGANLTGWPVETFVQKATHPDLGPLGYFNNQWLRYDSQQMQWEGKDFTRISLRPHTVLPEDEMLRSVCELNAVLVHRLRSPLTGMQGYLGLMRESQDDEQITRYASKLQDGVTHMLRLLDELDLMQGLEQESDIIGSGQKVDLQSLLLDAAAGCREASKRDITVIPGGKSSTYISNSSKIRLILDILLQNAAEHPTRQNNQAIILDLAGPGRVRVTNFGNPIREDIARKVFHPFITEKAQSLGIGLTVAHLLARQIGASILLTSNSVENGISFELLMPPALHSQTP